MKMHDINPQQERVILLLHPMLATAEMMELLLVSRMGSGYRYLVPDLAGHGEAAGEVFESASKEAAQIRDYLLRQGISRVQMAYGASMGGTVLMELLRLPEFSAEKLFFEGASFFEHAGFLGFFIKKIMVKKHRIAAGNPERAVTKMGELYGRACREIMARQMIGIREQTLRNIMDSCCHVVLPALSVQQQEHCVFAYGETDGDLRGARKTQPKQYPASRLVVWPGCGHCTHVTEDPAGYAKMLVEFLDGTTPK